MFVVVRWAVDSSPGRVWQAIRENELRVEVLGLRPYPFKLIAFVLASFLADAGGVVYAAADRRRDARGHDRELHPDAAVMVVLGGAGTRWGAMIGGVLYTLLDQRLGASSASSASQDLPAVLRDAALRSRCSCWACCSSCVVFFVPGRHRGPRQRAVRGSAARRREPAAHEEAA